MSERPDTDTEDGDDTCPMCEDGSWPRGSMSCPVCDADLSHIDDPDFWEDQ